MVAHKEGGLAVVGYRNSLGGGKLELRASAELAEVVRNARHDLDDGPGHGLLLDGEVDAEGRRQVREDRAHGSAQDYADVSSEVVTEGHDEQRGRRDGRVDRRDGDVSDVGKGNEVECRVVDRRSN